VGGRGTGGGERVGQAAGPGRTDQNGRDRAAGGEVGQALVGHQPATPDHHQVVGDVLHLGHQVAGDEDGTALSRQPLEQVAYPEHTLGVQPVERLVEHQHRRVAQQGHRDPEPLAHAEGEPAHPAPGGLGQAHLIEDPLDPLSPDPVAARQNRQVRPGRPSTLDITGVQQRADPVQPARPVAERYAVDGRRTGGGAVQAEHQAQGGRLARTVRPEETGDPAGPYHEGEVVDRDRAAVPFGKSV
jgi:hypothetical protein